MVERDFAPQDDWLPLSIKLQLYFDSGGLNLMWVMWAYDGETHHINMQATSSMSRNSRLVGPARAQLLPPLQPSAFEIHQARSQAASEGDAAREAEALRVVTKAS